MNPLPRRGAPWADTARRELHRPRKLVTFALGRGWLLSGALNDDVADGHVGIRLLTRGLTCLLASWSIGRRIPLRRPDGIGVAAAPAALAGLVLVLRRRRLRWITSAPATAWTVKAITALRCRCIFPPA